MKEHTIETSCTIDVIVWHHERRTARPPYSAAAYLINGNAKPGGDLVEAGNCDEASNEVEAARLALRALQEALGDRCPALVIAALVDPVGAITERWRVG